MTRAKKVILALICAAALCCAAIGGVLLARPAAEVRAEEGDLAIASVDGQIYDINTIDEIKEMLTVTRVGADGQARPISEDEEYTLTIQYEGEEVTMVNGIFPESYFGTDGNRTSAEFTLTVKDASDKTASTTVTVQWAPDTGYAQISIVPVANASAIYPYTGLTSLASNRYIKVYLLTAEEVRDGKTTSGFSPVGAVLLSGDLGAPDDAVLGTKYEVELEAEYTGSENVLFDTCRYTVLVTPAAPTSLLYNIDGSTVHKSANGAYTGIVAGDTIEDIVKSDLNFNVSYALGFRTIDGTDVHIKGYEYCDEDGTVDEAAEAFAWGEDGYVYMKVTYEECGVTQTAVVEFQLTQSPITPYNITAKNAAAEEQPADRPYGEEQYALVYQYSRVEGEAGEGSPWTVSFANIDTSVAKITQVTKAGDDSFDGSKIIAADGGSVTLTDVGTYTISLTLQSGGYSWADMDAATRTITYTVVIEQAELVGTKFTFGGGWTYGEEANLPAEIKLVSCVDEGAIVSFTPPTGATIKVTFTGTPNGGTQQTYSYTYTQGSQPSVTPGTNVPSLAGSYTVYVEVTGMANYADVTFANSGSNKDFQREEFTIASKGVAVPELTQERYTYTGETITAQYSPITSEQWTASGEMSATDVKEGGYSIAFALKDSNNYCWGTDGSDDTDNKTLTWYIDKADNEITGVDAPGWTYGEAVIKPQITGSTFAENTHGLKDWDTATITYQYNGQIFDVPENTLGWHVGEYTYTITYAGNANINEATYTGTFTVAKGQAVIDGTPTITGWTYDEYDETANAPSGVTGVTVSGTPLSPTPGSYAYYGTANGGEAYGSEDDLQTEAPEAAGTYYVVYVVEGTDDYAGATGAATTFTISRAPISPVVTINGQGSGAGWEYDGEEKAAAVTGNLGKGSVTYTYAGRNHTTYGGSVQPTDAGEYTVTATVAQTNNYLGGEASLDFTISQKGVTVALASDTQYTYMGAAVNVALTVDGTQVALTDNEYFTAFSGCAGTDAGSYTATIAWKGNYKARGAEDDFATAQRTQEVGTWTIDPFAVSLPKELAKTSVYSYNGQFVGTQQTWKWDNYNGFGTDLQRGTPFNVTVSASGSGIAEGGYGSQANGQESGYLFATEAGTYTFTLELTDTKNFVWASGGTDAKELTWTIGKAEVSVDVGERQLEYDGNKKAPANIVDLVAGDTSVPSAYQNLYTVAGYAAGTTSAAVGTTAPNNYGTYYVAIDLKDGDNFVWKQAEQSQDVVSADRLFIWYQITGTTYEITIGTISGWTYGTGTPSVPTLSGDTEILQDVIENYGSAITYTYQRQGEGGQWTNVYEVSYDAGDASYLLSVVPAEVAGTAGTYRLIVNVSEPSSHNYAAIVDEYSNPFTISPYALTEDDIAWSEPSLTYQGSAYTYGKGNTYDVYARYSTYTYTDGKYVESADAFFSLTLTSGEDAFTDAGNYTFTASTESGNYALPNSLAAKTYTIARAELTISVTGTYEITYGDEAPTQFTFGYDTLLGNDSAEGWGVTATTDYEQFDPISSDTVKYTISIVEKDYDPNYTISYVGATLTVKAAELQGVKIDNLTGENALTYQGAAYDIKAVTGAAATAVNPAQNAVTWYFSESEITSQPTNETQGLITSLTNVKRNADNTVGTYTIYYYVSAPNHAAQTGSVQITITPAELTLTAKDITVVYGEEIAASAYGYTVSGLVGNDRSNQTTLFAEYTAEYSVQVNGKEYAAGVDAGSYSGAVTLTNTDELNSLLPNYSVQAPVAGDLTVSPRAITVEIGSVPNASYGTVLNATDLFVIGIKATNGTGDGVIASDLAQDETTDHAKYANVFTLVVKNGDGVEQTLGTALSVGVYTIEGVAGGSRTDNYTIAFVNGSYSVGQSALQVLVTGASSAVYDGAAHGYTVSVSGVNGAAVTYTVKYTDSEGEDIEGQPVDAGTYTLHIETDDSNYAPYVYQTGFTITPRPIEVEWDVPTLVYNGEDQLSEVIAKYFIWENGEKSTTNSVELSVALQGGGSMIDAGAYTAEAAFKAADGNYTLDGATNPTTSVAISPRPIVVTIENKTSEYGDALQTLTATEALGTVTGWTDDGKGAIVPGDAKPYDLYIQDHTGGHLAVGSHNIFGSDTEEGDAIDANYAVTFRGAESANHGVYTVSPRAVTIEFAQDEYTATYGTQFDFAAAAAAVTFARGTEGAQGDAFASGESFASVLNGTAFAVIADGYGVTSAANSAFTMKMTLGSSTAGEKIAVGNYTFTFTDAATLTVEQRAITVTIADKTGIEYGTNAVANTQLTATATLASGSGEAIVNGDTEVYLLAVYDADKNEVTRGSKTPAGEYFIVGKAENNNYAITFIGSQNYNGTGDAGLFEIVVSADGITVNIGNDGATVTYTGSPYYLLDKEEGPNGTLGDLADELELGAYAVNADWTDGNPFLWEFRLNDENGGDITSLTDVKDDAGSAYTIWYKVYLPDVPGYAAKTGTFTVTIAKAENAWTEHYEHTGWAYKGTESGGNINLAFDGLETGSRFTPAAADFGTVSYTYYGSRSGSGTEGDPYVYGDEKTKGFFNNDTPAGTYYVKVEVAGTKNYTALTDHHQLVVSKHVLTVGWEERNVPLGTTQNTLTGYDTALMSLNDYSSELTLGAESSQDKTLQVTFADTISGTFYVTLALSDGVNYAWMNPLSSNEELCRVSFSVALANNEVTITANGWTYGDVVTVALPGESAGAADRIVITATHVPGDDNSNVQIAYAYDDGAATEDTANGLSYVMGTLPTQAGTYWVRVLVTGDDTYAMGEAYAKFTIAKFQVAVPEAGAESSFTYDGGVKTYRAEIGAYDWADETTCAAALVKLANGSTETVFTVTGNRAIDAGSYTAAYVLADADNCEWASSWNEEFSWVIAKAQLTRPTIGSSGTDFIQTEYNPDVTKQLLAGFYPVTMSFEGATVGAAYYPEGGSSYLYAENAGTYEITLGIKDPDNYEWKDYR